MHASKCLLCFSPHTKVSSCGAIDPERLRITYTADLPEKDQEQFAV